MNQPIKLLNSDATLHNIHAKPKINKGINVGLPVQGSRAKKKFALPEIMVSMKCDLHSWMQGWVGVVPHPFFDVSKGQGKFELKNVPPGNYVLEAWHERLGTLTQSVTVTDETPIELRFTFTS